MAGPKSIFDLLRETNRKSSVVRFKGGGFGGSIHGGMGNQINIT